MKYRPDIDGLRALAILLVVIFHAFPSALPGGFTGVDIFFVISGYLISGVILDALEKNTFSFRIFYKRRILRIFPALILLLFTAFCAGWILLWPNEFEALGKHIAAGASFLSNIILYGETGYFDEAAQGKFLLNLWSLGVEEQFYLAFPLIIWGLYRWPASVGPALGLLFFASFMDNIFLAGRHPEADFYLPLSRFWELLAGALLQALQRPVGKLPQALANSVFFRFTFRGLDWIGVIFILAALLVCKNDEGNYPGWAALLPVAGTFALIGAGPDAFFNKYALSRVPVVYTGKISYTLYLWHWPFLAFAYTLMGAQAYEAAFFTRGCLVGAAILLAVLTYEFIERPIRFGVLFGKYKVVALILGIVLMGGLGLWIWLASGVAGRMPASESERYRQLLIPPMEDKACLEYTGAKPDDFEFCRFSDARAPVTLALLGDSHAHAAFSGMAKLGEEMGFNTLLLGRFPSRQGYEKEIEKQTGAILDTLKRKKDIKQVVVVTRGNSYFMERHNPGDRRNDPLPGRKYEEVKQELKELLKKMAATGIPVTVVEDNPDLDSDIRDAIPRKALFAQIDPVYAHTSKKAALERQAGYRRILEELDEIPGVSVLWGAMDLFCPNSECLLFDENGLPLYYDDDHLSHAGSAFLAKRLIAPALKKAGFTKGEEPAAQ